MVHNSCVQSLEQRRLLSAGDTDPTFGAGGSGYATLPVADLMTADVVTQADGKILVGGTVSDAQYTQPTVIRLNHDGSVDKSFGGGDGVIGFALGRSDAHLDE